MALSFQVTLDGKWSASGDALLDEVFCGFEGIVVAKVGDWGRGVRLTLERRVGRRRGERDRLRTGAGK
jgi:hypothetical protein